MKKLIGICICLLLIFVAIVPTAVYAADVSISSSVAGDIIYFLNPTAITTVDNYLFVADRIEDNRSAIICFDVTADSPVYVDTLMLDEIVCNLSDNDNDLLYVVTDKQVLELSWDGSQQKLATTTTSHIIAGNPAVDFAHTSVDVSYTEYYLTDNYLWRFGANVAHTNATESFDEGIACYADGDYIYYVYVTDNVSHCKRFDVRKLSTDTNDSFNTDALSLGVDPLGFFNWDKDITIFASNRIVSVTATETGCSVEDKLIYDNGSDIVDAAATGDKVFVLNNRNVVEIYANNSAETLHKVDTIGSDILEQDVPTSYTSFTLVKSNGYPANIVFRTVGENSVDNIVTSATEYVVIGYDGDDDSNFYYVLVRDEGNYKFGWVKKSDGNNVESDSKLQIVDTSYSKDGNVLYKSVFSALNAVWIYDLPCSRFQPHSFTQSPSKKTEVTILQQFEEQTDNGKIVWLYVSYVDGTTKTGFVKQSDVGEVSLAVKNNKIIDYRKINTTLFSYVRVYMFGEPDRMTDDYLAKYTVVTTDEKGNKTTTEETIPKLYSGQRVSVISEQNGVCLVEVTRKDGAVGYGYVYSDQLIAQNKLTTNATVGIITLTIAVALGATLTIVFIRRRRGKKTATSD